MPSDYHIRTVRNQVKKNSSHWDTSAGDGTRNILQKSYSKRHAACLYQREQSKMSGTSARSVNMNPHDHQCRWRQIING